VPAAPQVRSDDFLSAQGRCGATMGMLTGGQADKRMAIPTAHNVKCPPLNPYPAHHGRCCPTPLINYRPGPSTMIGKFCTTPLRSILHCCTPRSQALLLSLRSVGSGVLGLGTCGSAVALM